MDGYTPIKTKADQRAEKVDRFFGDVKEVVGIQGSVADHLKHRLSFKTIAKEIFSTFTKKILPQGADELGNWLNTGSPYLPWPGPGQSHVVPFPQPTHGVHGPTEPIASQAPSQSADNYLNADYQPVHETHNSLYLSGGPEWPIKAEHSPSVESYTAGDYPQDPRHNSLYLTGEENPQTTKTEPPANVGPESHNNLYMTTSYTDMVEQARNAPGRDDSKGISR